MRTIYLRIVQASVSHAIQGVVAAIGTQLQRLIHSDPSTVWRDSGRGEPTVGEPVGTAMDGPAFYDDEGVFERYQQVRGRPDAPALAIEQPTVLAFLGDLRGRTVLDLGCGDAWIGRYALERGASNYLGLDGSQRMLAEARRVLTGTSGEVRLQDLERWSGSDVGVFDVVVSRLAMQYIKNLAWLFEEIHHHLRPGGLFVFSIEHPVMTSSYDGDIVDGIARVWRIRNYFREGDRADHWLGAVVLKQHRTLETYIHEIYRCGFHLDHFSEGRPNNECFQDRTRYEARLEVPICAIFRCVRAS